MNLSKSGGLDQGSTGDQSDHSEVHSPPPSIHDEDENISDDNVSDVDERDEEKDEGMCWDEFDVVALSNRSDLVLKFRDFG